MKYTVFLSLTVFLAGFRPQECAKNDVLDLSKEPFFSVECNANGTYVKVGKDHTAHFMCGSPPNETIFNPKPTHASSSGISTYNLTESCLPTVLITIRADNGAGNDPNVDFGHQQYEVSCTKNPDGEVKQVQYSLKPATNIPISRPYTYKVPVDSNSYGMSISAVVPNKNETSKSLGTGQAVAISLHQNVFVAIYGANADVLIPINCTASQGSNADIVLWSHNGKDCNKRSEIVTSVTEINGTYVRMTVFTMKAFQLIGGTGPVTFTCQVRVCAVEDIKEKGLCQKDYDDFSKIVIGKCTDLRKRRSADKMQRGGRIQFLTAKMIVTEDVELSSGTWNYAGSLVSGVLLPVLVMVIM